MPAHPDSVVKGGDNVAKPGQTARRLLVAQSHHKPEEELVLQGQGNVAGHGRKLVGAIPCDAAVDDLPEGIQVVALA